VRNVLFVRNIDGDCLMYALVLAYIKNMGTFTIDGHTYTPNSNSFKRELTAFTSSSTLVSTIRDLG
jgi:hypothetical protein